MCKVDKLFLLELYSNINYSVLDSEYLINFISMTDDKNIKDYIIKLLKSTKKELRDNKLFLNNYIKGILVVNTLPKDKNNIDFLFNKLKRLSELKGSEIMNYIDYNKMPIYCMLSEKEKELIKESYTLTLNYVLLKLFDLLGVE